MLSSADMERVLENLDRRLSAVEQTLPTLATKLDLERFATKADLERFATKADLERFATKAELERFATKADLESGLAQVRAFTEHVREEARAVAAGYGSLSGRVDALSADVKGITYTLDTLVMRLEAKGVI